MLRSERLILRLLSESDTDCIVRWRNQKEIIDNLFSCRGITLDEHICWYRRYVESKERIEYIIVKKEDDKEIGTIGFSNIDYQNQKAEYGIMLGELDEWGKGYAKEASIQIIDFGFKQLNLQKVHLRVFEDNKIAVNLYRKLGFLEEGFLRKDIFKDGEFKDVLIMSILRNEWNTDNV